MTEQQVPQVSAMMGKLVAHQSAFNALPKSDRQYVHDEPKAAIGLMVTAVKNRKKEMPSSGNGRTMNVLRLVTSTPKPAENGPFKADDTFFSKSSGVKIAYLGDNFKAWMKGKVEEDGTPNPLTPYTLTRSAYDNEIIPDLGGEEAAESSLADIWALMERQANGKEGVLLTNSYANIFYVKDANGVLRAVFVDWRSDGWNVYASALGDCRWDDGDQVFSRNS